MYEPIIVYHSTLKHFTECYLKTFSLAGEMTFSGHPIWGNRVTWLKSSFISILYQYVKDRDNLSAQG